MCFAGLYPESHFEYFAPGRQGGARWPQFWTLYCLWREECTTESVVGRDGRWADLTWKSFAKCADDFEVDVEDKQASKYFVQQDVINDLELIVYERDWKDEGEKLELEYFKKQTYRGSFFIFCGTLNLLLIM